MSTPSASTCPSVGSPPTASSLRGESKGTVLIVPGYTGSKEDWRTFMPLLREAGWTAVAISRRGQADSAAPTSPSDYSLDEEAADVVRVAALLDDGAPVHLIGHSLGGVIARAAAIASPGSFRSVVQFCSGPYGWPYRKVTELTILHDTGGNNRTLFDATNPLWAYRPDEDLPDDVRMVRDRFDATSPPERRRWRTHPRGPHRFVRRTPRDRAPGPRGARRVGRRLADPVAAADGRGHRRQLRGRPHELPRPPTSRTRPRPSRCSTTSSAGTHRLAPART
ncbi:alpha/beta hydrolase family protein [Curtobacterium sp. MCJR17_043]|uniref:alpha/beta hydrolase n=1 Tax=Curtobacterium sp. MCJR17_043 TaxID=2175660 RepID=UPI0024DF42BC|nr:alpha/beta hydrolase family protein [Curtobacterium sp. MCJR17_043]WIB36413.1 alpha/beta hydrolase family protein [Curtobacterium sp. MCJR17_043]